MKRDELKQTILTALADMRTPWDYNGNPQTILNNEIVRVYAQVIRTATYTDTNTSTPIMQAEYVAYGMATYIASIYSGVSMVDAITATRTIIRTVNNAITRAILATQKHDAIKNHNTDDDTAIAAYRRAVEDCRILNITDDVCETSRGGYMRGGYALQTKKRATDTDGKKRVKWVNLDVTPLPAVRGRIILPKLHNVTPDTAPIMYKAATPDDLKNGHYHTTKNGVQLHTTRNGNVVPVIVSPKAYGDRFLRPIADALVFRALDLPWSPNATRRDFRVVYLPTLTVN